MEKKIAIKYSKKTFIIYQNEVRENNNSLYIYKMYDIRELMQNQEEIAWLADCSYYYEDGGVKKALSESLLAIECYKRMKEEQSDGYFLNYRYDVYLYKDIFINDIQSFYDFYLEIETCGMRTIFDCSQAYIDAVYVKVPQEDEMLRQKINILLGEPETVPENEHDKYGMLSSNYIVPISKIDKIIGIKKYRNVSNLKEIVSPYYIGEEEITLDLHHFNLEIYRIFEEHGMLNMYDDEKIEQKYKYDKSVVSKKTN